MISAFIRMIMHMIDRVFRSGQHRENWNQFQERQQEAEQELEEEEKESQNQLLHRTQ